MKRSTFLNVTGNRCQRNLEPEFQPQWKLGILISSDAGFNLIDYHTKETIWTVAETGPTSIAFVPPNFIMGQADAATEYFYKLDTNGIIVERIEHSAGVPFLYSEDNGTKVLVTNGGTGGVTLFDKNLAEVNNWASSSPTFSPSKAVFYGDRYLILAVNTSTMANTLYCYDSAFELDWSTQVVATGFAIDQIVIGTDIYVLVMSGLPGVATEFSVLKISSEGVIDTEWTYTGALVTVNEALPLGMVSDGVNFYVWGGGGAANTDGFIAKIDVATGDEDWFRIFPTNSIWAGCLDAADGLLVYSYDSGSNVIAKQSSDNSGNVWATGAVACVRLFVDPFCAGCLFGYTMDGRIASISADGAVGVTGANWANFGVGPMPNSGIFFAIDKYLLTHPEPVFVEAGP